MEERERCYSFIWSRTPHETKTKRTKSNVIGSNCEINVCLFSGDDAEYEAVHVWYEKLFGQTWRERIRKGSRKGEA
jgi:hypothetical protein